MLKDILNDNDSEDEADVRASVQIAPEKLLQLKPQEKSVVAKLEFEMNAKSMGKSPGPHLTKSESLTL